MQMTFKCKNKLKKSHPVYDQTQGCFRDSSIIYSLSSSTLFKGEKHMVIELVQRNPMSFIFCPPLPTSYPCVACHPWICRDTAGHNLIILMICMSLSGWVCWWDCLLGARRCVFSVSLHTHTHERRTGADSHEKGRSAWHLPKETKRAEAENANFLLSRTSPRQRLPAFLH
jgi:hypothetical protein